MIRGLWSLLWHSVALLPLMMAQFVLACYVGIGLLIWPIFAGIYMWYSDWWLAAMYIFLWISSGLFSLWYWRWQRTDDFDRKGMV